MVRAFVLLTGLAGLVLAACVLARIIPNRLDQRPVFTVAAIRAGLARDARAWLGRSLLVRGVVSECGPLNAVPIPCLASGPLAPDRAGSDPMPLLRERPDPVSAFLRRLPMVGSLVPPPQVIYWDTPMVYRIVFDVQTQPYCGARVCFAAVLVDRAAP